MLKPDLEALIDVIKGAFSSELLLLKAVIEQELEDRKDDYKWCIRDTTGNKSITHICKEFAEAEAELSTLPDKDKYEILEVGKIRYNFRINANGDICYDQTNATQKAE
jgi:hypothetical protein